MERTGGGELLYWAELWIPGRNYSFQRLNSLLFSLFQLFEVVPEFYFLKFDNLHVLVSRESRIKYHKVANGGPSNAHLIDDLPEMRLVLGLQFFRRVAGE